MSLSRNNYLATNALNQKTNTSFSNLHSKSPHLIQYTKILNNNNKNYFQSKSAGKISIPIHDVISVSYPNRKNTHASSTLTSPQHTQQVFPVLNSSTSINSVEIQNKNNNINSSSTNVDDFRCFTINYAKRCIDPKVQDIGRGSSKKSCQNVNIWRIHSITLHNNDKYIVKEWYDTLSSILNSEYLCANVLLICESRSADTLIH